MPRKPISGPCEMSAGIDQRGPGIVIMKCGKPGVGRPDMGMFGPPIACDDCHTRWRRNQQVRFGWLDVLEGPDQRDKNPGE